MKKTLKVATLILATLAFSTIGTVSMACGDGKMKNCHCTHKCHCGKSDKACHCKEKE